MTAPAPRRVLVVHPGALGDVLHIGADGDYEILGMYGPDFKVLRLKRQLSGEQALAVTYRARRVGHLPARGAWPGARAA